jgi:Fibronectin type III domain
MNAIRHTTLPRFSALLMAALILTGCNDEVATTAAAPAATPPPAAVAPVTLSGSPPTSIAAGQNYLFQPTLTSGGGVVTFAIQGQPKWATFDANTGVLTGTPAAADVGKSGNITITGSNGSSSSSIGPFAIVVNASASSTGSASLSWVAPTQNTDGTPIVGLAGYHIYYGTSAGAMTTTVTLTDPTETSYVVSGLAPGTYYFSIVAYNSAGVDSSESNTASKTI